jgi:hypothetical protein
VAVPWQMNRTEQFARADTDSSRVTLGVVVQEVGSDQYMVRQRTLGGDPSDRPTPIEEAMVRLGSSESGRNH